jgi:hypothetical protein
MSEQELRRLSADADAARKRILSRRKWRLWAHRLWEGAEWELERRVLAARPSDAPPTAEQRRFLALLQAGPRNSYELAEHIDLDDPKRMAAMRDACDRGWIESRLGGIGGIVARPPAWFELTAHGETALNAKARD